MAGLDNDVTFDMPKQLLALNNATTFQRYTHALSKKLQRHRRGRAEAKEGEGRSLRKGGGAESI